MTYIIDPAWVYWMNISNSLKIMMIIIGALLTLSFIIIVPISFFDADDEGELWQRHRKAFMAWAVLALTMILIGVFIPDRQTLIEMKVAELATRENVMLTVDQLKEVVDYIVNALKELK